MNSCLLPTHRAAVGRDLYPEANDVLKSNDTDPRSVSYWPRSGSTGLRVNYCLMYWDLGGLTATRWPSSQSTLWSH